MRRASIAVLLFAVCALPVCAQRWSSAGGRRDGIAIGSRRGGIRIGGGIGFGHNPRWNVIIGTRSHYRIRPYYRSPFAYPYAGYPVYPYALYDTFDDSDYTIAAPQPYVVATPQAVITTPQPYYPYYPDAQVGLDTQMRQQHVGIYRPPPQPSAETPQPAPAPPAASAPQPEQPLTVLVYRDGRCAEVHNYAIVGQTLWIFTEQRAQKVPLSALNLEATRKANDDRGIEFAVPSTAR